MSSNEEAVLQAKQEAAARSKRGEIPSDLTERLDSQFRNVAPAGSTSMDEVASLIEALLAWQFVPDIPRSSTRARGAWAARFAKRVLAPLTTWQLRHLTDQMNAYSALQAEVLRAILRRVGDGRQ
ncbi:MAG TPA: hypothetical protein VND22_03205 [Actinomycetota bacterium]|nr:hypothetical protein [Actinomycetota bacterium]